MKALIQRSPLLAFFLLAYGLTWVIGIPLMLSRRGLLALQLPHWLEPLAAFGPFVAAMLVAALSGAGCGPRAILASLMRWRVGAAALALSLLSPWLILALSLVAASLMTGGPGLDASSVSLLTAGGVAEIIIAGGILQSLGEEPGWRGLAWHELRRSRGPLAAALLLFPVWLCWHLPSFLGRPEFGWAQWAGFSLGILAASIWLGYIIERTNSLLMAVTWHALINICRSLALALSVPAFLAFGNLVLIGALVIAVSWLRTLHKSKT